MNAILGLAMQLGESRGWVDSLDGDRFMLLEIFLYYLIYNNKIDKY